MSDFFLNKNSKPNNLDLFQFAVLNPQIAILAFLKLGEEMSSQPKKIEASQQDLLKRLIELQKSFITEVCNQDKESLNFKYNEKEKNSKRIHLKIIQ